METRTRIAAAALALSCLLPASAGAAELEVSGWIPYWAAKAGARDAARHLDQLDVIHPFAYGVKSTGKLDDQAKLTKSPWKSLFRDAARKDVLVVPSIMWSDAAAMERILTSAKLRKAHVKAVVSMVEKGKYDGVDIDYEGKTAETRDGFSAFLRELRAALDDDAVLSCTIEARTDPELLYRTVPAGIEYANDFDEIGEACDRVVIMGYDQGRAVYAMNENNRGEPYGPVADVDWSRAVAKLAALSIPKSKLVLGVPTYGYGYELTVSPDWYQGYERLWTMNPDYAEDIAEEKGIEPYRNNAGEAGLTYFDGKDGGGIPKSAKAPAGTPEGLQAAARALAYANETGKTVTVNFLTWSDAEAVRQKVALAKELGLRGVAIFKIDGGEDADIWEHL